MLNTRDSLFYINGSYKFRLIHSSFKKVAHVRPEHEATERFLLRSCETQHFKQNSQRAPQAVSACMKYLVHHHMDAPDFMRSDHCLQKGIQSEFRNEP